MKTSILAVVAAAAVACGAAQAHILKASEGVSRSTVSSSQHTLAVMTAAGINYHAKANYKDEQRLFGAKSATKSAGVRPDNRGGVRGV